MLRKNRNTNGVKIENCLLYSAQCRKCQSDMYLLGCNSYLLHSTQNVGYLITEMCNLFQEKDINPITFQIQCHECDNKGKWFQVKEQYQLKPIKDLSNQLSDYFCQDIQNVIMEYTDHKLIFTLNFSNRHCWTMFQYYWKCIQCSYETYC